MKKHTLLCAIFLLPLIGLSQTFEEVQTVAKNFYYSSSDVADLDGDGFLDIVINGAIDTSGDGSADTTHNEVYKNTEGDISVFDSFDTAATHLGDIKFIDFNNDGLLDIIATGLSYNDIVNYKHYRYINTGSGYELDETLPGKIYGSLEVFDFNNDGLQDYAINGTQYIEGTDFVNTVDLYTNNGDGFDVQEAWLDGTQNGSFKVIDINNDTLLDLIVFGYDADQNAIFKVYLNNNGVLELHQDLPGMSGKMNYADFTADGYLDIVVTGTDENYDEYLAVLFNDGTGNFEISEIENEGLGGSSVDVGDLNNDGYYDFIVIGEDANYDGYVKVFLYNTTDQSFSKVEDTNLYDLGGSGNIHLFDLDNNHHLDVLMTGFDWYDDDYPSLTLLYKNLSTEENEKPLPPTELFFEQEDNTLLFSWEGASDDKTSYDALRYEIAVGTSQQSYDIAKYVVTGTEWFLELQEVPDNIYWSVKAIDASKVYSDPAEDGALSITDIDTPNKLAVYPNPVSDALHFTAQVDAVKVVSIDGRVVSERDNTTSIDVTALQTGVYTLVIEVQGRQHIKKVIVQ